MTDQPASVSRRQIIKAAAGGATMALLRPAAASAAEAVRWDHEADIVCVGGGAAALSAATTAHANGDAVLVVEKMPVLGGTTAKSGAAFWIPNNFLLRQKGIEDAKADCLRYLARYSDPELYRPDSPTLGLAPDAYALLEAFYDNAAPAVDRLRSLGVLRVAAFEVRSWSMGKPAAIQQLANSTPDYFGHAAENKVPSGRSLGVAREDGSMGAGTEMIGQFEDYLRAGKVPILLGHRVTRLIRNATGEVIGVAADKAGKSVQIRARKAVIFGTGGFIHNREYLRLYQANHIYGTCAAMGAQGDFLRIAGQAGALLGNLTGAWREQVLLEEALEKETMAVLLDVPPGDSKILVNKYGRRVVDEFCDYNDRTKIHFVYDPRKEDFPNQLLFMVFDQRTLDLFAGTHPLPPRGTTRPYIISGDTFAALATNIQTRLASIAARIGTVALAPDFAAELAKTVERFNGFAKAGKDEDFGRGDTAYDREWFYLFSTPTDEAAWKQDHLPNHTMYPLRAKGPYYAIIFGAGALDTNGGPVINAEAQVMGYDGTPIPGLYGAGNCIASPSRQAYFGAGTTIGLGMTFGCIAANNAHLEPVKRV